MRKRERERERERDREGKRERDGEREWKQRDGDREGKGRMEKLERVCVIGGWGVLYFPCTSMNVCV